MQPTVELHTALEPAYTYFNKVLFDDTLPNVIFTNQRQKGSLGYFAPNRWASLGGVNCHEIAINPTYISKTSMLELLAILVHEMVHCWQQCFGKPSKGRYHNKEWSAKMFEIGLTPSNTGKAGGKIVGQSMHHYPTVDGKFIKATVEFLSDQKFSIPWIDRLAKDIKADIESDETIEALETLENADAVLIKNLTTKINGNFKDDAIEEIIEAKKKKLKSKYTCIGCDTNIWGKPNLELKCTPCDLQFIENT
jgi:predicted SprT family Zn-dependent metalloprotease